ncbi:MAG: tetratricopeptide repeat protein [Chloroflexi bacterium]|nr:tetratricopeptide repeat protein [Chloroflexota bacterium]
MPPPTATIEGDTLTLPAEGAGPATLTVDTLAWRAWLADAKAFAYRGPEGHFTARKERAGHGRGGHYWKAYRRRDGRLRRVYLGQDADLTLDRLRAAAAALAAAPTTGGIAGTARAGDPATPMIAPASAGPWAMPRVAPAGSALPASVTSFIGRAALVELLRARLPRDDVRLLVLIGPGGVGKTRLALQVALALRDAFAQGTAFVSLAPLVDPALVPAAIAQALGVPEVAGHSVEARLTEALRSQDLLLVLDNFEQVAAAAPLLADLLAAAPRLTVLVTSRAVLNLSGEHDLPVPPLALPEAHGGVTAAQALQAEAVQLFVARAEAARPDFMLTDQTAPAVVEICRRLDGLPLAIELAAARLRSLPVAALLARLERRLPLLVDGPRDAPTRQQTLRDTIAWSYDLLDPDVQDLFRRLAVFRGATLETIAAVCCAAADGPGMASIALPPITRDAFDGVTALVEQSLLRYEETVDGQPWYVMLETVREFALERLAESGAGDVIRRRQVLACLRLTEHEHQNVGPEQGNLLRRLDQEHDNLRAVLDWCAAHGYADPAFRLAERLWWFWLVRGHVAEGRQRLTELCRRFPVQRLPERLQSSYATAVRAAGILAAAQGDHEAARVLQEEGLTVRRQLGDPHGIFAALDGLGMIASIRGDHLVARRYLEEALALGRTLDSPRLLGWCQFNLGGVAHAQGDLVAARALLAEAASIASTLAEPDTLDSATLYSLAIVASDQGDYGEARRLALQSLTLYRQSGNRRHEALALARYSIIVAAQGDVRAAADALDASLAIQQELGDRAGIAFVLERYAGLAARQSQPALALRLAAGATALRERIATPLTPDGQARLDADLRLAHQALGARAATDWSIGRMTPLEELIALTRTLSAPAAAGADARSAQLTQREQEVAALIARGYRNRDIAAALFITEGTVANHVVHILSKLGYTSRTQIGIWVADKQRPSAHAGST